MEAVARRELLWCGEAIAVRPGDDATVLLLLEGAGNRLRVAARPRPVVAQDERWFEVDMEASGYPFAGTVTEIVTEGDLERFRDNLTQLTVPGDVVLGGDRAAELRLVVEPQVGGEAGRWVVDASLTPSGDDPYPLLRWLIFDQRPFVDGVVVAINELLASAGRENPAPS